MLKILGALLLILLQAPVFGSPCDHCEMGTREKIHLAVTSIDMYQSWMDAETAKTMRDRAHARYCPNCKTVLVTALDRDALPAALEDAARNCQEIALLTTFSHGESGALHFGERPELNDSLFDIMELESKIPNELECVMAPSARINLYACSLASGQWGPTFLTSMADRLLKKGGIIQACASLGYSAWGSRFVCPDPVFLERQPTQSP